MCNLMWNTLTAPFGYAAGSFGILMVLVMILWWAIIISLIVWGIKWAARQFGGDSYHGKNSALEILKERYVKGEINKSEFEEKKKDLEN